MKKAIFFIAILVASQYLQAQNKSTTRKAEVVYPTHVGVSRPLRELFINESPDVEAPDGLAKVSPDKEHRKAQVFKYTAADGPQYGDDMHVRQTVMGNRQTGTASVNWQGQTGNSTPPDPTGAAGLNEYVQCVNATTFKIWDKATGNVIGTVHDLGNLWSPAVGDGGDCIVLYDKYADRWLISQLSDFSNDLYIAVSTSGDPSGTYYTYIYSAPNFPDYPKYSVWADGYYMTLNYSTGDPVLSSAVFCFERDQMIAGNPAARMLINEYDPGTNSGFFAPMPADADGQLPPYGTPLPFISYYENSWGGGASSIKIWSMSVDWTTVTPTSTITQPVLLLPAPFDGTYDSNWNDIPQPNSSALLDGMGGIIQFRAQWRKWTGYNTLLVSFPVKLSSSPIQRSIRWEELRQDQGTGAWSIYQESTYAPDLYSRWMSAIAMDDEGNISLCYAKSGPTSVTPNVSPSLAYTGRLATDPLNTMTFAETVVIAGSGAMGGVRFGDYAQTSLDPQDGITFWHTGEYVTSGNKRTRIYSFKLSSANAVTDPKALSPLLYAYQSENVLTIQAHNLPSDDLMLLDLFDSNGRQVMSRLVMPSANSLNASVDIHDLSKGAYFIRIGKNNSSFQKVIKVVIM